MYYLIKGSLYKPIEFGKESYYGGEKICPECYCPLGERHLKGCEYEQCPRCGQKLMFCDCGCALALEDEDLKQIEYFKAYQELQNAVILKAEFDEIVNKLKGDNNEK